jgi:hypothetical protein
MLILTGKFIPLCLWLGFFCTATSASLGAPNIPIAPAPPESEVSSWPADRLDWATSPVDLSFLNQLERPAGKHGFLKPVGEKLAFTDGTPVRFWGTNLTARALFRTTQDSVRLQARRLSQLGFNLVRLHHIDSEWVHPNVFGDRAPSTQTLDNASLEKLDWWIKCLKDEGIYVWLDLHDGRRLTGQDGIEGFAEISDGKASADLKGFNYINTSIQAAMEHFNELYLSHVNRFTRLAYKDDPAVAVVMLTNENDVTHHLGPVLLPNQNAPLHGKLYKAKVAKFAEDNLDPKSLDGSLSRNELSKAFLNDLEHQFNVKMIEHLRSLGVKVPIVTTSTWGRDPLSSLLSMTDGDIIDVHSYGVTDEIGMNPLRNASLIDWIAAGQIAGRPISVTEWNVSRFPVPDRDTIPLYIAGAASFQGWDALMQFAYSQEAMERPGKADNWEGFNDPGLIATMPAAALLYRRYDVREAATAYVFAPTPEQLLGTEISAANAIALRTAAQKGKLLIALPAIPELPWLKPTPIPPNAKVITDPQKRLVSIDAGGAIQDTGELTHDWRQGIYKIDTPRTQAVMGRIGGKTIALTDTDLTIETQDATVAVQSLDNDPIHTSASLMISLGSQSFPTYPENPDNAVFRTEPVIGHMTIRARKGLRLYARDPATKKDSELPVSYDGDLYSIELHRDLDTHWLFLK